MSYPSLPQQPQWQPPVPQPVQKKHHPFRWFFGGIGVVVLLIVIVAAGDSSTTPNRSPATMLTTNAGVPPAAASSSAHTVVYSVTGTARSGNLNYTTDGSTSSADEQDVRLPWTKTLSIPDGLLNVYQLMAQNNGSGSITCTITVDGAVVKTVTATGSYAVADCTSS